MPVSPGPVLCKEPRFTLSLAVVTWGDPPPPPGLDASIQAMGGQPVPTLSQSHLQEFPTTTALGERSVRHAHTHTHSMGRPGSLVTLPEFKP